MSLLNVAQQLYLLFLIIPCKDSKEDSRTTGKHDEISMFDARESILSGFMAIMAIYLSLQ